MVDAAPKVDHTNHANKLVAKGLMATRGILAVAMLAGAAGLGVPVSSSRVDSMPIEGGGDTACTLRTFDKFPRFPYGCPDEWTEQVQDMSVTYMGEYGDKGSYDQPLCQANVCSVGGYQSTLK